MERGLLYGVISYGAPPVFFGMILLFLVVVKKEARHFLFKQVIGTQYVRRNRNPAANEANDTVEKIETIIYVEFDDAIESTCCRRTVSYALTTLILATLLTIIFEGCVLASVGVVIGDPCPEYPVECFYGNYSFYCNPGDIAMSPSAAQEAWCFGWIFRYQTARDVIDVIGVSGGLLGIISCIIPLVYYISAYKDQPYKAFFWIWLPFLPLVALLVIQNYTGPMQISILAKICLIIVFCLGFVAWLWAFISMYKKKNGHYPWSCCCPNRIRPQAMHEH